MAASSDREITGGFSSDPRGDAPQTLGDLRTPLRMTRTAWLIAIVFFVAVLSFFIVVVCLGVTSS